MKNVTVTLDEEVARWARIRAAEAKAPLSYYLGDLVRRQMEEEEGYEAAMHTNLARPAVTLKEGGDYPNREERNGRSLHRGSSRTS